MGSQVGVRCITKRPCAVRRVRRSGLPLRCACRKARASPARGFCGAFDWWRRGPTCEQSAGDARGALFLALPQRAAAGSASPGDGPDSPAGGSLSRAILPLKKTKDRLGMTPNRSLGLEIKPPQRASSTSGRCAGTGARARRLTAGTGRDATGGLSPRRPPLRPAQA